MLISKGTLNDIPAIHGLITELSIFEKEPDAVITSIDSLQHDFLKNLFDFFVVKVNEKVVGFALYYWRYSTWKGKSLYLEDFYMQEVHRNKGYGKLLFEECIREGRRNECYQMNWQVLDWNKDAIRFYKNIGAAISTEWYNGTLIL